MQFLVLIQIALVLLEDRAPLTSDAAPAWALAAVLVPPALALLRLALRVRRAMRLLDANSPGGVDAVHAVQGATTSVAVSATVGLGVGTLAFGWLACVRAVIGDWPAIDEVIALLPALLAQALAWWLEEPLERRIRESALVRRLDEGLPVPSMPSRSAFVWERVRMGILLLLVPVILVVGCSEALEPWLRGSVSADWADAALEGSTLLIAALVYLVSPWIARLILDLRPLPPGDLRDDLRAVCSGCGVKVRAILLWNTRHAMVNGAVMGLVAPIRYVMLTDALLELLPRDELRAVMAHEIGHVRRRHLPWMIAAMVGTLAAVGLALEWTLVALERSKLLQALAPETLDALGVVVTRGYPLASTLLALVVFGWISRRFERQADTFAAQYLSRAAGSTQVTPGAVTAMTGALGSVTRFAGVDPTRFSWRHGAIRWRQVYLATLVGRPLEGMAIDRLVRLIKLAAVAGLLLVLWTMRDLVRSAPSERYDAPRDTRDHR